MDENAHLGASVGDPVAATDADGDPLIYAVTGSTAFGINALGQLSVRDPAALDYETNPSHSFTVAVTDGKNAAGEIDLNVDATIAVTVNVVNVDEAGVVSLDYETDPPEVGGQLQAILLDPDIVTGAVAWSWWRDDSAAIAGATGDTYTATAEDAGKRLRAMASYADGHGAGKSAYGPLAGPIARPSPPRSRNPSGRCRTRSNTPTGPPR